MTTLTNWQTANGLKLDMVFNAAPSVRDDGTTLTGAVGQPTLGSLSAKLLDVNVKNQLRWINHTYDHVYYGCVQMRESGGVGEVGVQVTPGVWAPESREWE